MMNLLLTIPIVAALFGTGIDAQEVKCLKVGGNIGDVFFAKAFLECTTAPFKEVDGQEFACLMGKFGATDAESSRNVLAELANGPDGQQVFTQAVDACVGAGQELDQMTCMAEKIFTPTGPCNDVATLPTNSS